MTKFTTPYKDAKGKPLTNPLYYINEILRDYMQSGLKPNTIAKRYNVSIKTVNHILFSGTYKDSIRFLQDLNRLKFENKFRMEALQ